MSSPTLDRLTSDLTTAMKARDSFRTGTLRQLIAAVRAEAKAGPVEKDLTEDDVLRVLARDGRRVTGDLVKRPSGSCNVIDGPALDWLAAQAEPRFWLSDGLVTGVGDASGTGNTHYAERVMRDAKITRVRTTAELFAALRRAARATTK